MIPPTLQPPLKPEQLLVIKLGALGDFIQALGPFKAIRNHFPSARISLLTTRPFVELAENSGYFDKILLESRPRTIPGYWQLRRRLRAECADMIFDLQTSDRSCLYWQLLWPNRPPLSGIAWGASHPHRNPQRDAMHSLDRQREQLAHAGIAETPPPSLDWARADISRFRLPDRFAVLVPGGAAHRPAKRWPAAGYTALAGKLLTREITPVLIGGPDEVALTEAIRSSHPEVINLAGKTGLYELATLTRHAELAVGNDTGPMHMAAVADCPCLTLFSDASNPSLCAPRGKQVEIIQRTRLEELAVETVWARISEMVLAPGKASA